MLGCTSHDYQLKLATKELVLSYKKFLNKVLEIESDVSSLIVFGKFEQHADTVFDLCQIDPYAEVTADIDGYASVWPIERADAEGKGTLVELSLPVTLTYNQGNKWCLDVSCDLTALKLSASIYYRLWNFWRWDWGERRTFKDFGTLSAIEKKWQVTSKCTSDPQVAQPWGIGWGEWILTCFGYCY